MAPYTWAVEDGVLCLAGLACDDVATKVFGVVGQTQVGQCTMHMAEVWHVDPEQNEGAAMSDFQHLWTVD